MSNSAPDPKMKRVLIIDDDEFIASMFATKLIQGGFSVSNASNATMGLELAQKCRPDVILLDILMPDIDGFAVLRKLQKHKKTSDIPVIMLTSLSQKDNTKMAMAEGAFAYIVKSGTTPEDTLEIVSRAIKERPLQH